MRAAVLLAALALTCVTAWYKPAQDVTWQWQLSGDIDTSFDVDMYDIDLFDAPEDTIKELKQDGRAVVCYFSAGSYEDWRPDVADFPSAILGSPLDGWAGERWLDVRASAQLYPIMEARMDLAVSKGCDAVEPDNLDAYDNDSGFDLSYNDSLTYNIWLASAAHARDLGIAHKVNRGQVKDLVEHFDFHLDEQCFEYDECDLLQPYQDAGKAVIGVDYREDGASGDVVCPQAEERGYRWLIKNLELDAHPTTFCWDYVPYWWLSLVALGVCATAAGAYWFLRVRNRS